MRVDCLTTNVLCAILTYMTITQALRDALRRDGRSLGALAAVTGVDKSVLSRLMRGRRNISVNTADAIVTKLGLECQLVRSRKGR